jgi:hypothetical protein
MDEKDLAPASHEGSDISGGFIAIGFTSTVLGIVLLALLAWALYPDAMIDRTMNLPLPSFPEPRLQIDPAEDWTDFHRRELTRLNSAGWIDQAKGAHIPPLPRCERSHEGITDWPTAPAPHFSPPKENANEAFTLLALLLLNSFPAYAQRTPDITGVAYKQKLGARLPLESAFTDADGQDVRIGDVFNRAPVILVLGYFHCDKLCGVTRLALLRAAQKAGLSQALTISSSRSHRSDRNDRRRTTGARYRLRRGVASRRDRGIPLSYRNAGEHSRRSRGCRI